MNFFLNIDDKMIDINALEIWVGKFIVDYLPLILKKFKNKVYEKDVVYFIFAVQIIFIIIAFFIFL